MSPMLEVYKELEFLKVNLRHRIVSLMVLNQLHESYRE